MVAFRSMRSRHTRKHQAVLKGRVSEPPLVASGCRVSVSIVEGLPIPERSDLNGLMFSLASTLRIHERPTGRVHLLENAVAAEKLRGGFPFWGDGMGPVSIITRSGQSAALRVMTCNALMYRHKT
jgi:hypothetical protein